MRESLSRPAIETAVMRAMQQDVLSLKPGNVHRYAAGHDMTVADFETSARLSLPWLVRPGLGAGERLYHAVRATQEAVGCNTNLGILMLFIPLIMAVERSGEGGLQQRVKNVLQTFDGIADAEHFFAAIRLAAPGGLGDAEEHDVNQTATVSIREAMCAAQHRDRIAAQYVNGYADVFGDALNCLLECKERWRSVEWALVACYLSFLSQSSDSHIARKYGEAVALQVRQQGEEIFGQFITYKNPEEAAPLLFRFDTDLKAEGINPGTSADLAVACMLASEFDRLLAP